jgi:predicted HD phosphohydrolase
MASENIINLYKKWGSHDYIGENITQITHALQSAKCAENDTRLLNYLPEIRNCVIIGALLHDIGHLVGLENNAIQMVNNGQSLGIVGHEGIGSEFLKYCGMNELVCELVKSHVQTKRYLCSIDNNYYDNLSDASKATLQLQGSKMSYDEIEIFRKQPYLELKIYLREYDDNGKNTKLSISDELEQYKKNIEQLLDNSNR